VRDCFEIRETVSSRTYAILAFHQLRMPRQFAVSSRVNALTCPRPQIKINATCLTLSLFLAKPYLTITSLRGSAGAAWVWSTRPRMHAYTGLWH